MNRRETAVKVLQAAIIVALNLLLIALAGRALTKSSAGSSASASDASVETLSRLGSRGSEVREIQTRLKSWGYYKGGVDGIYGAQTKNAVIYFQKKNGLTADGVVGTKTLQALGINSGGAGSGGYGKYSSSDYNLLARVISAEARGEPYVGQVAVGAVILNRVQHPSFPSSIPSVIYQPGAFTCLTDGQFNETVASSAYRAAQDAINGWDPTNGSIYYYNPATATSSWIWSRPVLLRIGRHVFCK